MKPAIFPFRRRYIQNIQAQNALTNTSTTLIRRPTLIMDIWGTLPVAKASALGGVDTGSMNAQEAPMPTRSTSGVADIPMAEATVTISGATRAALAVLEQNSVRDVIKTLMISRMIRGFYPIARSETWFARNLAASV